MKKLWGTLALGLVLFATLFSYELNAADNSNGAAASNCTGANGESQLSQYCGSSQSASQGSDANSSLWKVWGGVGVVCLSACTSGNPAGAEGCNISQQGGTVTQGVVTKNYTSGLISVAQSQGTSALASKTSGDSNNNNANNSNGNSGGSGNSSSDQTADNTKAQKAKARKVACAGAAAAIGKAVTNYKSMQTASQAASVTKQAAASLDSSAQAASGGKVTTASARGNVEGSGKDGMSAATAGTTASVCASARQTSSTAETLQCAAASDPTLPSMVTSGQLAKAFTQASGTSFSNFGNDPNQSPGDAIAQAASGSMSPTEAAKVAALVKGMEGDLMAGDDGAVYTASGGGAPAAQSDEPANAAAQAELQEQMKEMLAKAQDGQPKDDQNSGISAVIYANQNRSPASVTEDKTLSIFDRVTYRYYFVIKQSRVENFQ